MTDHIIISGFDDNPKALKAVKEMVVKAVLPEKPKPKRKPRQRPYQFDMELSEKKDGTDIKKFHIVLTAANMKEAEKNAKLFAQSIYLKTTISEMTYGD